MNFAIIMLPVANFFKDICEIHTMQRWISLALLMLRSSSFFPYSSKGSPTGWDTTCYKSGRTLDCPPDVREFHKNFTSMLSPLWYYDRLSTHPPCSQTYCVKVLQSMSDKFTQKSKSNLSQSPGIFVLDMQRLHMTI